MPSGGCTCEWQIDLQSARLGFERCEAYRRCLDHVQAVRLEHGREQAAHHADAGVVGVQGDVGCGPQVGNCWLHREGEAGLGPATSAARRRFETQVFEAQVFENLRFRHERHPQRSQCAGLWKCG